MGTWRNSKSSFRKSWNVPCPKIIQGWGGWWHGNSMCYNILSASLKYDACSTDTMQADYITCNGSTSLKTQSKVQSHGFVYMKSWTAAYFIWWINPSVKCFTPLSRCFFFSEEELSSLMQFSINVKWSREHTPAFYWKDPQHLYSLLLPCCLGSLLGRQLVKPRSDSDLAQTRSNIK